MTPIGYLASVRMDNFEELWFGAKVKDQADFQSARAQVIQCLTLRARPVKLGTPQSSNRDCHCLGALRTDTLAEVV